MIQIRSNMRKKILRCRWFILARDGIVTGFTLLAISQMLHEYVGHQSKAQFS
jgi:hypothetical protein